MTSVQAGFGGTARSVEVTPTPKAEIQQFIRELTPDAEEILFDLTQRQDRLRAEVRLYACGDRGDSRLHTVAGRGEQCSI